MVERHPCKELHDKVQVAWGELLTAKARAGDNAHDSSLQVARNNHRKVSEEFEDCVAKNGHP